MEDTLPVPSIQTDEHPQTTKLVPIEVKWNIPAWIMRDPGPEMPIEDDDIDWQERQVQR